MEIINSVASWVIRKRVREVELFIKEPHKTQQEVFKNLVKRAKDTVFGKQYDFNSISAPRQFRDRVPVSDYNKMLPYIERLMHGEQHVLWPSEIRWFAKSSGTTSSRSKFIPVSRESLDGCHYKGAKDLIAIYLNNFPDSRLFTGKGLIIGGSQQVNQLDKSANSYYGDVSAVLMKNMPFWAQFARTPRLEVALMEDWEAKLEKMTRETMNENVTSISGVPTWTVILIRKILETTGKSNILEVWPNLELFIHGAVSFTPYRDLFRQLIPSAKMHYVETYNASEGFFALQDQSGLEEMLLMLDYGIYYEFVPLEEIDREHPKALGLDEVELNKNYAMIISTNGGLWRYNIGDTIKFTSLNPYRIKITGRTRHFINAFGEEVIVENAESAIAKACEATGAVIENFTAAPRYFGSESSGCHEWVIEFRGAPDSLDKFTRELDQKLRQINSDYDAKRQKDIALKLPVVHAAPVGIFYEWMKKRGKLGGQNKVPRLTNTREYIDDILTLIKEVSKV